MGGAVGSATALIQYTLGSTGDPKDAVLSHANLLIDLTWQVRLRDATRAVVLAHCDERDLSELIKPAPSGTTG